MRRTGIFCVIFLVICLAVVRLPFFKQEEEMENGYRVAAVVPPDTEDFWRGVWEGIESTAEEKSIQLSKYKYESNEEESKMISKLETAILSKVDGILLCSNQYSLQETQDLLQQAKKKGIKIVLCDCDANTADMRDAFVGVDNAKAGELGAEKLSEITDIKKVLLIQKSQDPISSASMTRKIAFEEYLSEYSSQMEIEAIQLAETSEEYYRGIQDTLLSNGEGNAVVCFNSVSTLLMAQTIERLKMEDQIFLLGFCEAEQALDYVESGVIDILLMQDNEGLGRQGMIMMQKLLSDQELETDIYHMDMSVITKETAAR